MQIDYTPPDDAADAPRQSYNFAPGYHGAVYRADTPDWGAGPRKRTQDEDPEPADEPEGPVSYKLQSMKWGLVPFWTKRNPDYATIMRTINCREDSLSTPGGMWASMKGKKRCIVIAQGFFEWLKVGPKEKMPHYVKRKDGRLMCFAGLWDCVQYEGELFPEKEARLDEQDPRTSSTHTPLSLRIRISSSSFCMTVCPSFLTLARTR